MGNDQREIEFQYAWEWFKYHASQRLLAFNFYLIFLGILGYGFYLAGNGNGNQKLQSVIAISGAFISVVFWLLEVRNEELVNCGRRALQDKIEGNIGVRMLADYDNESRPMLKESKGLLSFYVPKKVIKHRVLLRLIFVISFCCFSYLYLDLNTKRPFFILKIIIGVSVLLMLISSAIRAHRRKKEIKR